MATDNSFLYDSIEVDANEIQPYDPRAQNHGRFGQQYQHPGVSDSFDYHYVDTNGHSLQASADFNPAQSSSQWNYNAPNYHDDQYGATVGYPTYGSHDAGYVDQGDTGMYYDSIDATANYYESYPYPDARYVDENSEYQNHDRYYDTNTISHYQNNVNPVTESIVRDSLEVGNDMSRYEDVDASFNENNGTRSKYYDRKSTVNESTMSFMSNASQGLMGPDDEKPFFNPDVEAHQHAINIQSSWRGHDTRKEYKKASEGGPKPAPRVNNPPAPVEQAPSYGNSRHDYDHHATVIQSNYRGYKVRKQNVNGKGKEAEATKKSGFIQNEDEAATAIQSSFRGYKSRKDYNERQKEGPKHVQESRDDEKLRNEKATVIQSNYRGYKARKDMRRKEKYSDEDDATNIQGALRGRETRKQYEVEKQQNQSATVIQANYRGYKTRKELKSKRKKPQKELTQVDYDEHAEKIQGVVRGRKARNDHMRAKKEHESAVVIQSNYRGYRTRKQMKDKNKNNLDDDATRLQGALRGRNAREAHAIAKEEEEDASQIQAVVKGRAIRLEYEKQKEENESATLIQANYRGYQARKKLKAPVESADGDDDDEAATSIQGALKGREARKEYEAVKEENRDAAYVNSNDEDATLIQGALLGHKARNEFDKKREREENAAVIQAGYRGYKARKEMLNSSQLHSNKNVSAKNTGGKNNDSRKASIESGKKLNEEKSLEAAWDRNREMARKREATSNTQSKGKSPGTIGQRKYTEYLEHNKWAQRQDKRRAGEPVSRLPTMAAGSSGVHAGNVNKKETAPRPAHSKNSNVSFSDPYYEHESRNYPKSPLPPATAEYSDVSSVTSEEDSVVQRMERERLRSQILQEEKKPKPRKPGEVHNKETLQTEIMNGKRERKREENNEERDRTRKLKHEKYNKPKPKQMVRNYSSETLDSPQEDNESLYEFDPKPKRIQEYKLKGYRRKGKWIKPNQQSDDDLNSMEDETSEDYEREPPIPLPPHGHGHPYAHAPYGYPYGMPQYPFPVQNGMGMAEPPHVAFVPVPWNSMHPLEQTLLASQLGPAMQMPVPPVAPNANASTSVPRDKEEKVVNKQTRPKVAPGKDFVEKNKAKAVTREQEKGSYKQIAMKQAKKNVEYSDESFQDIPVKQEIPKVAAKKKAPAEMIATKTSINDGGTVKVDINLNIPPEQLAAMLGLDPRKLGIDSNVSNNAKSSVRKDPSPTKDRSPVKDRSPIRNVNENAQVTHRMNKPPNPTQNASPSKRKADQVADQDKGNVIRSEKGLPTKQKEPNPYKKIPPISTNNAKPDRQRKDRSVSPKGMPQHRPVFYKPYTLDDYKALNLDIKLPVHLGPEHEKIEEKRKAKDRQESYARFVREQNMTHMQTTNKFEKSNDVQTKLSRRKVGIEYSKSVPRPKQIKNDESDEDSIPPMNEQMQRIEELKRRHEQDKNAVAKT